MISVICVYNNQTIFNYFIRASLKKQTTRYEFIFLDNRQGQYPSAARALNEGAKQASGRYLMFVHQDIRIESTHWLEKVEQILDQEEKIGMAGVAGSDPFYSGVVSNITHGTPPRKAGIIQIESVCEVQTLDECLVIVPRKLFEKHFFFFFTCNGWHLYAVDLCLTLKTAGYHNIVLPLPAYHQSTGHETKRLLATILRLGWLPREYYQNLIKVLQKHQKVYPVIHTTCGTWLTTQSLYRQRMRKTYEYTLRFLFHQVIRKAYHRLFNHKKKHRASGVNKGEQG